MHKAQKVFCAMAQLAFPHYFNGVNVLDVGSLDINGNNRYLFTKSNYLGLDITKGRNVDIVRHVHRFETTAKYDTIISTEMLEHDITWKESVRAMYNLLKEDGLLLITCATTGRKEHGTFTNHPNSSPATNSYYRNVTKGMFEEAIHGLDFKFKKITINAEGADLYFYAIKK